MPILEPSSSAPTTQSSRSSAGRTRSNTANRAHQSRVFSAQHLDDVSNYHDGDHGSQHRDECDETLDSANIEMIRQEDHDGIEQLGDKEVPEHRNGIPDDKDLEANLEKTPTRRSVKDPNLVSVQRPVDYLIKWLTVSGLMGWSRRPRKSQELVFGSEVGCNSHRVVFHLHFACLLLDGGASFDFDCCRISHKERSGVAARA